MTRDELLRENEAMHRRVLNLIAGPGDDRLSAAGAGAEWSVKDHLAHLASWQQYVADLLTGATTPRNLRNDAEMDRLNAELVAESRGHALARVRQDFQSSYEALRAQVERLDDDALAQPPPYGRDWQRTLWQHVAANGFDHYREHVGAIEELLRG